MINVRRLTVITLCVTGSSISGNILRAQDNPAMDISVTPATEQTVENGSQQLPDEWTLQNCIDYALEQNITLRKSRITAESTAVDVKTAKAALFPSLSFSTSQNMINRPYQESSSTVSGSENQLQRNVWTKCPMDCLQRQQASQDHRTGKVKQSCS